jgi:hypothetical protein
MKNWLGVAFGTALGGCAGLQLPDLILSPTSEPGHRVVARMSGGFITLSANGVTCGGNYDAADPVPATSTAFSCVDGRKGTALISRQANSLDGTGRLRLDDGTEVDFLFGSPTLARATPARTLERPRDGFLPAR